MKIYRLTSMLRLMPAALNCCLICFLTCCLLPVVPAGAAANPYRLQSGARGKVCLQCHITFEETLKKRHLHTPVKKGDCAGCHNPHSSSHGALLAQAPEKVCLGCHQGLVPEKAVSVHQVVAAGECSSCHDPHGADYRNNLNARGNELCFGCHGELEQLVAGAKVAHDPVKEGCLSCHNPHASTRGEALLTSAEPGLCLDCHNSGTKLFKKSHMNYPVEKARCTSCHNPHGGSEKGIFYPSQHSPVANRMCNQCHVAATSATPFATRRQGFELCRSCHSDTVNDAFTKANLHWPFLDPQGCANCHAPHASKERALLRDRPTVVCGSCHQDTVARSEEAEVGHQPVMDGDCASCHAPHAGDQPFLLTAGSQLDLCGQCHDWQAHSTHPIGDKVKDPRNGNITLTCTSCHSSHGTDHKAMLLAQTVTDVCVQCHTQYRR